MNRIDWAEVHAWAWLLIFAALTGSVIYFAGGGI